MSENKLFNKTKEHIIKFIEKNIEKYVKVRAFFVINDTFATFSYDNKSDFVKYLEDHLNYLKPNSNCEIKMEISLFLKLVNGKYQWFHASLNKNILKYMQKLLDAKDLIECYTTWSKTINFETSHFFDLIEFDETPRTLNYFLLRSALCCVVVILLYNIL